MADKVAGQFFAFDLFRRLVPDGRRTTGVGFWVDRLRRDRIRRHCRTASGQRPVVVVVVRCGWRFCRAPSRSGGFVEVGDDGGGGVDGRYGRGGDSRRDNGSGGGGGGGGHRAGGSGRDDCGMVKGRRRWADNKVAGRQSGGRMGRRRDVQRQAAVAAFGGAHLRQIGLRAFLQTGRGLGVPGRRHHHHLQRGDGRVRFVGHVGRVGLGAGRSRRPFEILAGRVVGPRQSFRQLLLVGDRGSFGQYRR